MSIKKITITLFSFLLFSACSLFPSPKPANEAGVPVDAVTNEVDQPAEQIKDLSCDMLRDAGMKENCKSEVNQTIAQALQTEILHTFDTTRCAELNGYDEGRCKEDIMSAGVTGPVTLAEYDAMKEALRPVRPEALGEGEEPASDAGAMDVKRCDTVASALKEYCKNQMTQQIQETLLFDIIASKDSSRCDELTVQEFKDQCEQEFGTFVEPQAESNPGQVLDATVPAEPVAGTPLDEPAMDADTTALPSLFPDAGFGDTK